MKNIDVVFVRLRGAFTATLLSREPTVALKDKVGDKPLFETLLAQANPLSDSRCQYHQASAANEDCAANPV